MPAQFLGDREVVYQMYVFTFFTSTAQAMSVTQKWEVEAERYSRLGRLGLVIQRPMDKCGAIQEYKRIKLTKKDKTDGYGDSQGRRLTKHADDALRQVKTRLYRARTLPHATKLRKYGIAFLGPYCAVTGRLLERKPGEGWVFVTLVYRSCILSRSLPVLVFSQFPIRMHFLLFYFHPNLTHTIIFLCTP
ncbi:hypothetical protein PILCRDRAFT_637453 [Piloderma croceum F 1598]|uniref:Uncharacterized protein n=1 Tax=Piloderma croceum (strain F 1598) TaxID=765440 RepID=A0A0C3FA61_PILCF|nr:hypothetical protein PILCRDRAFT_637453 [Piloderma croceum F 1598]